ncbi:hypothetical protein O181_048134 [Austropuccinia psidii MF-1]|uniref:Uncharacterized protein n=1 Tax=Austropuccinia psidii MF-1 TaxID=1389203 RepID=A0A9Q3HMP3_9BASI|nr:hypothetical protein [Austropuccinia psidii MF-1]
MCFQCDRRGDWCAECPVLQGFAAPSWNFALPGPSSLSRPITPEHHPSMPTSPRSYLVTNMVLQIKFVEGDPTKKYLEDSSVSINLTGISNLITNLRAVHPFLVLLEDWTSTLTINQLGTLNLSVQGGYLIITEVPLIPMILSTILSLRKLVQVGVLMVFEGFKLSFYLPGRSSSMDFVDGFWWLWIDVS